MKRGLPGLLQLAELMRDRALADLATSRARRDALQARVDGLRPAHRGDTVSAADFAADFQMQRAAERHRDWAEAQRRALMPALARAAADEETSRAKAARAFGRTEALRKLAEDAAR